MTYIVTSDSFYDEYFARPEDAAKLYLKTVKSGASGVRIFKQVNPSAYPVTIKNLTEELYDAA